jgi:hypothetical protein
MSFSSIVDFCCRELREATFKYQSNERSKIVSHRASLIPGADFMASPEHTPDISTYHDEPSSAVGRPKSDALQHGGKNLKIQSI